MPPPPPSDHPAFRLRLLPRPFVVEQLKPGEPVPAHFVRALTDAAAAGGRVVSLVRTDEEVSLAYEAADADASAGWRCIKMAGPMEFGLSLQSR
jgi:hypothetical protein